MFDEKKIREYLKDKSKETILELYLQKCFDMEMAETHSDINILLRPVKNRKLLFKRFRKLFGKDAIDNFLNEQKRLSEDGELYYITVKRFTDEQRETGESADCLLKGNIFTNKYEAQKVLEVLFDD